MFSKTSLQKNHKDLNYQKVNYFPELCEVSFLSINM